MEPYKRIELLTEVLTYRRVHKPSLLTRGEAIAIHQERAGWYMVLAAHNEGRAIPNPRQIVSPRIECKIKDALNWIALKPINP